jgi:NAD(P)-dependent dehydrogenase (short-subunit alcohol dehydrogenase family)
MGSLEGRVVVITGAARGLGKAHAAYLASEGALVVVNDIGTEPDGSGGDGGAGAEEVAAQIRAAGGEAVASAHDVTDWTQADALIRTAVEAFGDLHVLVNNAGILRDRLIVNMDEDEWDDVVAVHLKGSFVPLHHAAVYWREKAERGGQPEAAVINVSSTSGLQGNPGQANYGAAKAGIGALTVIAGQELHRYGVRVNAIAPAARTRLTEATPGLEEMVRVPEDARFDEWDPANVSPVVGWLATRDCDVNGRMFYVFGGTVQVMSGWNRESSVAREGRWTIEGLAEAIPPLLY